MRSKAAATEASKVQVSVMLGKYFAIKGDFAQAGRHLEAVAQNSSELEEGIRRLAKR